MDMENLEDIAERIHEAFDVRTAARDQALSQTRLLTRHSAHAIRAVHRDDYELALEILIKARGLVDSLNTNSVEHPDFYYAGYTQDALKEFVEANLTLALVRNKKLPTPEELDVQYDTYLKGMAETVGELRRRCMDILRHGHSEEAERLLSHMDDIYAVLVTMDYPDAITGGLRRLTDMVRGVTERTRGDLTMSSRQQRLEEQLLALEKRLAQLPE
jgi:translin